MDKNEIMDLLEKVKSNEVSVDEAVSKLKIQPFKDLGFAKLDNHRGIRQGISEVVYGEGKTPKQIVEIAKNLKASQNNVFITRLSKDAAEIVEREIPIKYFEMAKIGLYGEISKPNGIGTIVVATGGTSDMPVAEEAAVTCEILGNKVTRLYDVGVSGIHRLLSHTEEIMNARVIITIAGMEGALASVIGGLADCPVLAVPTSVGYGSSFGGVTALLSMLNSCASGISVVNIDNGFGAGYQASMINHLKGD